MEKAPQLPGDISWHFIGHLQSNKVKARLRMRLQLGCWRLAGRLLSHFHAGQLSLCLASASSRVAAQQSCLAMQDNELPSPSRCAAHLAPCRRCLKRCPTCRCWRRWTARSWRTSWIAQVGVWGCAMHAGCPTVRLLERAHLLKEETLLPPQPSCWLGAKQACAGNPRTLRTTLPPLPSAVAALGRPPLAVFVQVNTSGEESKYGVEPQVGQLRVWMVHTEAVCSDCAGNRSPYVPLCIQGKDQRLLLLLLLLLSP